MVKTPAREPELKFVAGDPSLDFVNTVDWAAGGLINERLSSYDRLTSWAVEARLIEEGGAQRLRRFARRNPDEAVAALKRARSARRLLRRLFLSLLADGDITGVLREFNRALTSALRYLRLSPDAGRTTRITWDWEEGKGGESLDRVLWSIVWSAAQLLTSEDAARIRMCGGTDCGWLYVDRSRNHLRRWCDMKACGTIAKSDKRRQKARASAS
jgi:predicted RNA-binding Zn ribbon-like protein